MAHVRAGNQRPHASVDEIQRQLRALGATPEHEPDDGPEHCPEVRWRVLSISCAAHGRAPLRALAAPFRQFTVAV
jgi:hypothetical protein